MAAITTTEDGKVLFRCDSCSEWSEMSLPGKAEAEFAALFPEEDIEDAAVVCDDCFAAMRADGLF